MNYTAPLLKPDMIAKGYVAILFRGVGIYLGDCSACLVKDNIIMGHIYDPAIKKEGNSPTVGIDLSYCSSIFVENNLILNNNALQRKNAEEGSMTTYTNESLPAGISIRFGFSNFINDNKIENNFKGIDGLGVSYCSISNNLLIRNTHGIYFDMSSAVSCRIHHNIIQDNKNGISLGILSFYNKIYNNIIENNTIGIKGLDIIAAFKMFERFLTITSQYNTIFNNSIKNNDIGIYGKNWANSTICDNNIENNKKIGLKMVKSKRNKIYRNNFINDGILIFGKRNAKSSIGNKWDNGIEGNYWDDYRGLRIKRLADINKDGFGNIPYYIPRLQIDKHPKLEPYNIII
jgi:parallel beta-helix repeat protein